MLTLGIQFLFLTENVFDLSRIQFFYTDNKSCIIVLFKIFTFILINLKVIFEVIYDWLIVLEIIYQN